MIVNAVTGIFFTIPLYIEQAGKINHAAVYLCVCEYACMLRNVMVFI